MQPAFSIVVSIAPDPEAAALSALKERGVDLAAWRAEARQPVMTAAQILAYDDAGVRDGLDAYHWLCFARITDPEQIRTLRAAGINSGAEAYEWVKTAQITDPDRIHALKAIGGVEDGVDAHWWLDEAEIEQPEQIRALKDAGIESGWQAACLRRMGRDLTAMIAA